jgi:hypothetical protein
MTHDECMSHMNLNHDIRFHHTYKGAKINDLYIIPELGNEANMLRQSILGTFNLAPYLDLSLTVYAVYNKEELDNGEIKFEYGLLDVVVDDLDDNSW